MASDFLPLDKPVPDGGIENVRFFNGRLLSARDLTREQNARRGGDALAGLTQGQGIARGLEVIRSADDKGADGAVITVRAGVGINASGGILHLPADQRVQLTRHDSSDFVEAGCTFAECVQAAPGTYVAGEGLYLFVLSPSSTSAGRAAVNGLQGDNPSCNVDRDVDAPKFRLLEIKSHLYPGVSAAHPAFRNHVAQLCFGTGTRVKWQVGLPSQNRRGDDLLEAMRSYGLTPFDIPLAIIAFTGALDIAFLDMWAARRLLATEDAAIASASIGIEAIKSSVSPRRPNVGRAMLHQFQEHFAELSGGGAGIGSVRARLHFPTLPPVGILPRLSEAEALLFLDGMKVRGPVHVNAAQVEPLLRDSLNFPSIDAGSDEVVWLYAVAENLMANVFATTQAQRVDPYYVFAAGNVPYRADARFDLHRWNFANFALSG